MLAYDAERGTALAETLEAWFAAGGSLRATAELLHVHPNTVAQRLERVGQLLGDGWRDPARALDVQLALRMHRLRRLTCELRDTLIDRKCGRSSTWSGVTRATVASRP